MASTKIINVSKGDTFDEVFDLFKNTDAQEVIFIFPKSSRFTKQEQYFEVIKNEADSSGKLVSVMTADPIISEFATKHGIDLLEKKATKSAKQAPPRPLVRSQKEPPAAEVKYQPIQTPEEVQPESSTFNVPEQTTDIEEVPPGLDSSRRGGQDEPVELGTQPREIEKTDNINNEPEAEVVLAAIRNRNIMPVSESNRVIRDIFKVQPDHPLKIKQEKEQVFEVDIKGRLEAFEGKKEAMVEEWAANDKFKSGKSIKSAKVLKKMPLFLAGGAILVLFLILYNVLGSATVIIRPLRQPINLQIKVTASTLATGVDPDLNRIPGQRFSQKQEESIEVPTTGEKNVAQKAGGTITIYNKGSASQRLVATTRFKSTSGLIFRIPQTILVPGMVKTGDTITPGSIMSPVYADRPGEEYNIPADKFIIPGFEGTPKANDFYATSDKAISGGVIGLSKVVTEEDFTKAQETLTEKVKQKVLKSLKDQAAGLRVLDSIPIKFATPITNVNVNDAAKTLQMTISGTVETIAFKEDSAQELINKYTSKNGNMELLPKDLAIGYFNPTISPDNNFVEFTIKVAGQSIFKLDQNKILKDIAGMNEAGVRDYFNSIKEVESTHIILSPFWLKHIPEGSDKIKVQIDKN